MNRSDDRDQAIERLLRQSLNTPPAGATDACLDAETVAAWADGGLSGEELESAQLHAADCARCQAMVAGVVRTTAAAPLPEPAPRRWLAWLVPLTAAAVAVAVWVAVPRGPGVAPQSVAENRKPAAQEKTEPAAPSPLSEPSGASNQPQAAAKSDQAPRDRQQASELRKDADRPEVDRLKRESQAASGSAALADNAAAATAQASPAPAPAAPAPSASPPAREAFQTRSATSAAAEKLAASDVAVSGDAAIRWRISATGLEHSTDSGATWDSIATGVSSLSAIAAPSPTVCWVVGRSGVVLRTTDGRNFSRVTFPEITDLSSVQATDARSATVTTIDGRVFTTSDGGTTWQRR